MKKIKEYHNAGYGKAVFVNCNTVIHAVYPYINRPHIIPKRGKETSEENKKLIIIRVFQDDNVVEAPDFSLLLQTLDGIPPYFDSFLSNFDKNKPILLIYESPYFTKEKKILLTNLIRNIPWSWGFDSSGTINNTIINYPSQRLWSGVFTSFVNIPSAIAPKIPTSSITPGVINFQNYIGSGNSISISHYFKGNWNQTIEILRNGTTYTPNMLVKDKGIVIQDRLPLPIINISGVVELNVSGTHFEVNSNNYDLSGIDAPYIRDGRRKVNIPISINLKESMAQYPTEKVGVSTPLVSDIYAAFNLHHQLQHLPVVCGYYTFTEPSLQQGWNSKYVVTPGSFNNTVLFVTGMQSTAGTTTPRSFCREEWYPVENGYQNRILEYRENLLQRNGFVSAYIDPVYGGEYFTIIGFRNIVDYSGGIIAGIEIIDTESMELSIRTKVSEASVSNGVGTITEAILTGNSTPTLEVSIENKRVQTLITNGTITSQQQDYRGLVFGEMFFSRINVLQSFTTKDKISTKIHIEPYEENWEVSGIDCYFKVDIDFSYEMEISITRNRAYTPPLSSTPLSQMRLLTSDMTSFSREQLSVNYNTPGAVSDQLKRIGVKDVSFDDYHEEIGIPTIVSQSFDKLLWQERKVRKLWNNFHRIEDVYLGTSTPTGSITLIGVSSSNKRFELEKSIPNGIWSIQYDWGKEISYDITKHQPHGYFLNQKYGNYSKESFLVDNGFPWDNRPPIEYWIPNELISFENLIWRKSFHIVDTNDTSVQLVPEGSVGSFIMWIEDYYSTVNGQALNAPREVWYPFKPLDSETVKLSMRNLPISGWKPPLIPDGVSLSQVKTTENMIALLDIANQFVQDGDKDREVWLNFDKDWNQRAKFSWEVNSSTSTINVRFLSIEKVPVSIRKQIKKYGGNGTLLGQKILEM